MATPGGENNTFYITQTELVGGDQNMNDNARAQWMAAVFDAADADKHAFDEITDAQIEMHDNLQKLLNEKAVDDTKATPKPKSIQLEALTSQNKTQCVDVGTTPTALAHQCAAEAFEELYNARFRKFDIEWWAARMDEHPGCQAVYQAADKWESEFYDRLVAGDQAGWCEVQEFHYQKISGIIREFWRQHANESPAEPPFQFAKESMEVRLAMHSESIKMAEQQKRYPPPSTNAYTDSDDEPGTETDINVLITTHRKDCEQRAVACAANVSTDPQRVRWTPIA